MLQKCFCVSENMVAWFFLHFLHIYILIRLHDIIFNFLKHKSLWFYQRKLCVNVLLNWFQFKVGPQQKFIGLHWKNTLLYRWSKLFLMQVFHCEAGRSRCLGMFDGFCFQACTLHRFYEWLHDELTRLLQTAFSIKYDFQAVSFHKDF